MFTSPLAQSHGKISGWVCVYGSRNGLSDVNVIIKGTSTGTTTDTSGYFQIDLPADTNYTIQFSHIMYKKETRKLSLSKNENVEYRIYMKPQLIELPEVTKTSHKSFDEQRVIWNVSGDEIRSLGYKDLEGAFTYLLPDVLYSKDYQVWTKGNFNNNQLRFMIANHGEYNYTLYVNNKLWDSSDLNEIDPKAIKYIKVWHYWKGTGIQSVDMAPIGLPLVEGHYVVLIVTK